MTPPKPQIKKKITTSTDSEYDPRYWKPVLNEDGTHKISLLDKKPLYEETEEGRRIREEKERIAKEKEEKERRKKAYQNYLSKLDGWISNHSFYYEQKVLDFNDDNIYTRHSKLVSTCANELLIKSGRKFIVDESNKEILRFLMLYFNKSPLALTVFPDRGYSLNKSILLCGNVGVGKTFLMEVFSLYLKTINSKQQYVTTSQTQMLNHYKQHNNINLYTFNEDNKSFEGKPFNLCLNDIGLKTQKFYGNDTEMIIEEFLYARYEIWEQQGKMTHLTTNLDKKEIEELFSDEHGRLADRLKMFNVIPLTGKSRR